MDSTRKALNLMAYRASKSKVPKDLLTSLESGNTSQYLDAVSKLALDPAHSSFVFITHHEVFPEICSRWILGLESSGDWVPVLSTLAKFLPLAPYLSSYARTLLHRYSTEIPKFFSIQRTADLSQGPHQSLIDGLLMILRLLAFDNKGFAPVVLPSQMQLMMNHPSRPIKYLAIRILCLYLHASDNLTHNMIKDYVNNETAINAPWESKEIDYYFLSLWEEHRLRNLRKDLHDALATRDVSPDNPRALDILEPRDLSPCTARFGHVLLPRLEGFAPIPSSLVVTKTTEKNMHILAKAVRDSDNILVTGLPGAGKSALIMDLARELCRTSSTTTLRLNEQSDIKILLGVYTSDKSPGSFSWHPGVLTQAVLEGRWVVVEDIDRAPAEIISTLLPLLERGELFVQNWNETIRAAPGFKLIATIRSFENQKGDLIVPGSIGIGSRLWTKVPMTVPDDIELAEIVSHRYFLLRPYMPKIMGVYQALKALNHDGGNGRASAHTSFRAYGLREMLRWCRRLNQLLRVAGVSSGHEPISDSTNDEIFLEAIDCFAGFLASGATKAAVVGRIARELQLPPERVNYYFEVRRPEFYSCSKLLRIGRVSLPCEPTKSIISRDRPFAMTNDSLRVLESVCKASQMAEPCLLVGETGVGKTAYIQVLAGLTHTKLTVVNLSQQSEAGDLLGGYKPVSLLTLAIPMMEDFEELFRLTFSAKRNERYVDGVAKAAEKRRWGRVVAFWQEALQMAQKALGPGTFVVEQCDQEHRSKKRRMELPKYQAMKTRWDQFESKVRVFQMHLASGSKGFAFSFIEGNIVKAARNGDWILLDEINLAPPDTLEALADLLVEKNDSNEISSECDGGPSLLLPESGRSERFYAHKNFRVFAAMNPATDINKRDLPPSLRSRFTEVFVDSPDQKFDNLLLIIKEYLGSHTHLDRRVAADVANLFMEVKRLAEQNSIVDGSNQKPHFSLRTLTRTLVYVKDIAPLYTLRRALYEGFSMSFLTLLSAESGRQVLSLIDKYLIGSQANSRAFMKQIPRPPEDQKHYIQIKQYWIAQGDFPIKDQPHFIVTPFVERNLLNLVRSTLTRRFPILLQGPTSSGKTSMIEYLANITGNKFLRINNHEHTDIQEYLGTYVSGADGTLQYQDGILVRALREGSWIVLDELNLAPTDVLEALNRLLDDNKEILVPETHEVVRPHPNFMLFATQNPPGIYGGRKFLSRAFRNRFLELHFDDIPEEELETILRERCQIAPSFCTRIVAVYKKLSVYRQKGRLFEEKHSFATLRDLFRWALRDAHDREELAVNGFLLLAERVRDADERLIVKHVIEEVMKVTVNEQQIYSTGRAPNLISTVWTKSMLRLYVLVTEALKHNEPVLLVGNTGTGKTTVCQIISELMSTELYIVNAHQNMETSDLIGSQRPVRNKAHLEVGLARELAQSLKLVPKNSSDELPALLLAYDAMKDHGSLKILPERRASIEANRIRIRALFEWADGSLVQAMKGGQHFLLDEISLADDSVLERLNSVLEPTRSLFLAEKATDTAPITASHGFQLYATMNPSGDWGKRELSPALRNRFTEIWVPPVWDEQELLDIALVKLTATHTDLAVPMIAFAAWYSSRYNPIAPSISIRDLLSWVDFVNKFGSLDRRLAVLEGAAMVYIDALGADPAAKASISTNSIPQERAFCLSRLSELFGHDMTTLYRQEPSLELTEETLLIGSFKIHIQRNIPSQDPSYSLHAPTTRMNIKKIVRALQVAKPILLEGSPGVGKTTLVSAIARAIGMPLTRINLSDHTDLADLFGSDVPLEGAEAGRFGWQQAPFLRAMQKGEWVLLDEMNLASQSVLEGLNACLDHRGQCYVPELNQTFNKHDGFVVFAAQNPRQQGGGRKGLPISFINRFTVVYVENFTPDDLLIICNEAFEACSSELIAKTTQCITAVSTYLQAIPSGGLQGGPFEYNLRDAFRWLSLLASGGLMSVGTATDYLAVILVQRLRRSEDRALLSKFLQRFFPEERQFHSPFVTLKQKYVQVGLGMLARNTQGHGVHTEDIFAQDIDLSIIESMIFCVKNNWPCLLVGPSGCGKTRAIHQLARIVGANVVTIALNAETDTIDLVGGFEQVDPQRRVREIIRNLMRLTRQTMLDSIAAGNSLSSCIDVLQGLLQQPAPILLQVIESVRECALSGCDFGSLAEELEDAMQHEQANLKAQFRWVDGALVNALKDGAWLILDNANLCSPSILDRLNSLLEPNGILSINEHRAADGTARIVKPHPDFRLFLTVDPRHGEISRAMRNRSVELYLLHTPERQHSNLMLESSISRFAMFECFDWQSIQEGYLLELFKVCYDHLAFSDIPISTRWYEQVENGLLRIPAGESDCFSVTIQTFCRMIKDNQVLFGSIQETYQRVAQKLGEESTLLGFISAQASFHGQTESPYADATIHPMNNPFLVRLAEGSRFVSDLPWLGSLFDISLRFYCFQDRIRRLKENVSTKPTSCMSRLELALAPKRMGESETVVPIGSFLEKIEQLLHHALAQNLEVFDYAWLESLIGILLYAEDLLDVVGRSSIDESALQVYVDSQIVRPTHKELVASFSDALASLDSYLQPKSGLSMELIWKLFKNTPRESANLGHLLELEQLTERFDALSWTSGASIQEIVTLRSSMARVFDALDISDTKRLENDTRDALEAFERAQGIAPHAKAGPILQTAFEGLQQYSQCANTANPISAPSDPVLSLLSGRPTKSLITDPYATHTSQVITLMKNCTGTASSDAMLAVIRDTVGITILQKVATIPDVHLGSLDMLCAELKFLANRTATLTPCLNMNHLQTINRILGQIQLDVIAAHEKVLEPMSLAHYMRYLGVPGKNPTDCATSSVPLLEVQKGLRNSGYLSKIFDEYLNPSITMLHNASEHRASGRVCEDTAATAASWIQFFTGCLILYVPDRIFDPASRSVIERDRHMKRKTELEAKLWALQTFDQAFAGQSASLRSQIVQSELENLGEVPPIQSVRRPQQSTLGELQADFNGILQIIVHNSPTQEALQRLILGDEQERSNIELMRSHIARYASRLSIAVHLYEDITRPLISLLHGLNIGLGIALIAYDRANQLDEGLLPLCRMTPFLGMKPDFFSVTRFDDLRKDIAGVDMRLAYLKSVVVVPIMNSATKGLNVKTVREVFHSFYEEWKDQLSRNQKDEAIHSSLYRFRGSEDDQDEEEEQEFLQIFNSDGQEENRSKTMSPKTDPRSLAQAIAACQRNIFDTRKKSSQQIIAILQHAAWNLGRLPKQFLTCPIPVDDFLPVLIVQLDECSQRLQSASLKTQGYNFYADANVSEVKKLTKLLHLIQSRYSELHEVWPEHATIQDVRRVCDQLLATRHTEPVARLLSKAEQLHGFMHEWQLVASREFSTATLYEDLTALLVDWRRLELSTWAELLDKEDAGCSEDVDAWWFIAYEGIVVPSGNCLDSHADQLLSVLIDFLLTTSVGHYVHRLQMIEVFKDYVQFLAGESPAMKTVEDTLNNFLSFYKRFNGKVQSSLREGRRMLEEDMKEILLLASWKDTNINALNESAKRSHRKLFKVVRKYRTLLAQPAQQVLQDLPDPSDTGFLPAPSISIIEAQDLGPAFQSCRGKLPGWASRPPRLRNPSATALQMVKSSQLPSSAVDIAGYVNDYALSLLENIKLLRKETPLAKTNGNSDLVKHLKVRKRKLFEETLKDTRQMGFQYNISGDVLAGQATLSKILSSTPAFKQVQSNKDLATAESHWFRLLDLLTRIRERSQDPSQDLSHAEISRSIGYLESILSTTRKERATLAPSFDEIGRLDVLIETMKNFTVTEPEALMRRDISIDLASEEVSTRISWLSLLLDTSCVLLEKHGRLGEMDNSEVTRGIRAYIQKTSALEHAYERLPNLPEGLRSLLHEQIDRQARKSLIELKAHLQEWTQEFPRTGFVLRQLMSWTEVPGIEFGNFQNGVKSIKIEAFDKDLCKASDFILVAIQQMKTALSATPSNHKEGAWLTRSINSLSNGLKSLRMGEVTHALEIAMAQIQHLAGFDKQELQVAGALCTTALPIILQYRQIVKRTLDCCVLNHGSLCKLGSILAQSFVHILSEGFCDPASSSANQGDKTEKLEGGTGLGEGEGVEDISKDVQDDEDLSELAHGKGEREGKDLDVPDDAVDMDHDELDGDLKDVSESGTEDETGSGEERDDIGEETGDVDASDPGAVDEKLWDGSAEHSREEKEGERGMGKPQKDEIVAQEGGGDHETVEDEAIDSSDEEDAEGEAVVSGEVQKLDPHVHEEQNLDLPEEMDLDSDHSTMSDLEGSDLDEGDPIEHDEVDDQQPVQDETEANINVDLEDVPDNNSQVYSSQDSDNNAGRDQAVQKDTESPADTEPEAEQTDQDPNQSPTHVDDSINDVENISSGAQGPSQGVDQQDDNEYVGKNTAQSEALGQAHASDQEKVQAVAEEGQEATAKQGQNPRLRDDPSPQEGTQKQAFKKLGDTLEKWHRQQRQILDAHEPREEALLDSSDATTAEKDFEHLYDEQAQTDAQALGAATEEQAQALDPRAFDSEMLDQPDDSLTEQVGKDLLDYQDEVMKDQEALSSKEQESKPDTFIGKSDSNQENVPGPTNIDELCDEDMMSSDDNISRDSRTEITISTRSPSEARQLWSKYEALTHPLSLILTEQLRLILAPTLATKMRGDFRSGKRLNIKRIIPYIASNYKRDKIWMRRSVPQKRNYQVMLAVDDSKSMGESGSGQLAFEALVLVAKSLSMLEVGEIAVVGFGEDVRVAHEFDKPFSAEAGVQIIQQFGFNQTKTDMRKLVGESIGMFRDARDRGPSSSASELWQLLLVISDGLCEDHESIRKLVRQAQEERIMIVFVIVDAIRGESIVDMSQAVFEPDPDSEGGQKLKIKRYLEGFPFTYYLVVGDIRELPGVLATALRGWFSEVVGQGG